MKALGFLLMLTLSVSCSATKRTAESSEGKTQVLVKNDNQLDMTIFVVRAGYRHRLGMVPSYTERTYTIPDHIIGDATSLQFLADPIGSRQSSVSQELSVVRGRSIELVIPNF